MNVPPPLPPLPADLQRRLEILRAKAVLRRFPGLSEAVTALVTDAWCRQPVPEVVTATTGQLTARDRPPARIRQEAPDWTRGPDR